jgi:hypothetical protein
MNNPWEQWSPYWWQTVTVAPPFGMRFEPSATYAQPHDISSDSRSSSTSPAVPSAASSGILGQLGQPPGKSSSGPFSKPTSLLGQFLTGASMTQATQNGSQTETEAGLGNYITPAQSRSNNMAQCLWRYEKCHDLHSFGLLINGKQCQDCFNMCLLNGTWPDWYCPPRPF